MIRKDIVTMDLPGIAKRRGRPAVHSQDEQTLKAAAARRKRESRARLAAAGLETLTLDLDQQVAEALRSYVDRKKSDSVEITMGQAVERILRDRLLRPR